MDLAKFPCAQHDTKGECDGVSSFEAREHAIYGPQLENYAALVADLPWVTAAPIQKALYYPGIQHLALFAA